MQSLNRTVHQAERYPTWEVTKWQTLIRATFLYYVPRVGRHLAALKVGKYRLQYARARVNKIRCSYPTYNFMSESPRYSNERRSIMARQGSSPGLGSAHIQ